VKSARKPWISGITIRMRPELAAARDLSVDMCVFSLNAPGLGRMASAMDAYVWILLISIFADWRYEESRTRGVPAANQIRTYSWWRPSSIGLGRIRPTV